MKALALCIIALHLTAFSSPSFDLDHLELKPLEGGFSKSQLYSFWQDGQKYVLRYIVTSRGESFRMDEVAAHRAAASVGAAPEIIYAETHAEYIIMPFVEGHSLSSEDLKNEELIRSLAATIKRVHDFSGPYPEKATTLAERVDHNYKRGLESGYAFPSGFAEEVEKVLQQKPETVVPSHGDLNRGNILVNRNKISIIDWANGTFDDPFTDLCYITLINALNPHQEELFLSSYFGRSPTKAEWQRLKAAKRKYYLVVAAIWFRFAEVPQEQVSLIDQKFAASVLKDADDYLKEGTVVNIRTAPKEDVLQYALSFYKAYLDRR
jgi:thiamine kinase-like enzyme